MRGGGFSPAPVASEGFLRWFALQGGRGMPVKGEMGEVGPIAALSPSDLSSTRELKWLRLEDRPDQDPFHLQSSHLGEIGCEGPDPGRALMAMSSPLARGRQHASASNAHHCESPWMRDEFTGRNSAPDGAL